MFALRRFRIVSYWGGFQHIWQMKLNPDPLPPSSCMVITVTVHKASLHDRREELLKREARKIMNDPSHPFHIRLFKSNNPYDLRTISSRNILSRTERHKRSFLARASALT
jgi:hypothetical protein